MKPNTYKRIAAVELTTRIIKMLADQKQPVSGQEVSNLLQEKHGTVMCHLSTLEDAGFVMQINGKYQLGMALGLIWARVKSNLEASRDNINRNLNLISIKGES